MVNEQLTCNKESHHDKTNNLTFVFGKNSAKTQISQGVHRVISEVCIAVFTVGSFELSRVLRKPVLGDF